MSQTLLVFAIFSLGFVGMALGVIVAGQKKVLKGSCGGVGEDPDCCMTCPEKESCENAA